MSIIDTRTEFADAVSVAAAAGTYNLGNQIDLSVVRDVGNGQPVYLVVSVDTEVITGGAAGTIQFQFVSDDTASISTTTQTIHAISKQFITDDAAVNSPELNAGGVPFILALPLEGEQYEKFVGVQYIIGTTTTTAGNVSAYLTFDPRGWKAYPDASN